MNPTALLYAILAAAQCSAFQPQMITGPKVTAYLLPTSLQNLAPNKANKLPTAGIPRPLHFAPTTAEETTTTAWTKKRLHNTFTFRIAAICLALTAASYASMGASPMTMVTAKTAATVHLLSFSTWFGTVVYTTFIAGITMFKSLPRRVFGTLQSKLFPKYFSLCSVAIGIQLVTLQKIPSLASQKIPFVALTTSFMMTLINQFYLEPKSTEVMFERYKIEEESPDGKNSPEYKKLAATFGKMHGMSSLSNLVALCGAVVHGFFLAGAVVA
mmetsp:Transcript_12029/g.15028  ORF Transcript_12029/g.15028 Transcript_12029/m.15028 type:complete len:271 (-) Transcript_12029:94-906(-)|eukprot:CAMPEP_0172502848 /NCGR_PEP_ID=MMETSP1066-20121228/163240_1 /TAXON_ID=671091 /ORGANISM="Coscinodiscus wailesii, Strain CCMP2513" /LENGTH=270 /DNA_ID=CAMNT_0013278257 /DNA_START=100 /DNA_END=912 /DNA_ORIENTATION=+